MFDYERLLQDHTRREGELTRCWLYSNICPQLLVLLTRKFPDLNNSSTSNNEGGNRHQHHEICKSFVMVVAQRSTNWPRNPSPYNHNGIMTERSFRRLSVGQSSLSFIPQGLTPRVAYFPYVDGPLLARCIAVL